MRATPSDTRSRLLSAALKHFARRGYAGTSVQDIVSSAGVTKPALYYHFGSKTGLFKALVDSAHDERLRLMREAAARGGSTAARLEEILASVFEYSRRNADLMRLAFATAFATRDELPKEVHSLCKGRRNFEFICDLIAAGQQAGELRRDCDRERLAFGIYGQLTSYVMVHLLMPNSALDRQTARQIVHLFLEGAARRRSNHTAPAPAN
jgi:AcrR family transcriptional regulator